MENRYTQLFYQANIVDLIFLRNIVYFPNLYRYSMVWPCIYIYIDIYYFWEPCIDNQLKHMIQTIIALHCIGQEIHCSSCSMLYQKLKRTWCSQFILQQVTTFLPCMVIIKPTAGQAQTASFQGRCDVIDQQSYVAMMLSTPPIQLARHSNRVVSL